MKSKIFNLCISLMAIVGIICIIGGAGTADYMTAVGSNYSLFSLAKMLGLGMILLVPAIIRERFY